MTRFYKQRENLAFLLMPASGDRSFEEVYVVASDTPYEAGSLLVRGENDVYRALTASDLAPADEDGVVDLQIAILGSRTVFHEDDGATEAAALAVVRDATIKGFELELSDDIDLNNVKPFLEAQGLIVRS